MTVDPLGRLDPKHVGRYRLVARLGVGGMGIVYLARDRRGSMVALKLIRSDLAGDSQFRDRFKREVALASRVSGPFLVPVLDSETDADRPFLVTEFVQGPTLRHFVEDLGPLDSRLLQGLALGMVDCLVRIHRVHLVHRDLKPENVLLSVSGPRVIDFGIARSLDGSSVTQSGVAVGTLAWMSPEQASGGDVGPPSDMYSWAALVTFAAGGAKLIVDDSPPWPSAEYGSAVLGDLVASCLKIEPSLRPTAEGVLRGLLGDTTEAAAGHDDSEAVSDLMKHNWTLPARATEPAPLPTDRRKPPLRRLASLAVAVVLVVGGWIAWIQIQPSTTQEASPSRASPTMSAAPTPSTSSIPAENLARYSQHGVTFSYPEDWRRLNIKSPPARWNVWLGAGGRNSVSVSALDDPIGVTEDNLGTQLPSLTTIYDRTLRNKGGQLYSGPNVWTVGDLPAVSFVGRFGGQNGYKFGFAPTIVFDSKLRYVITCKFELALSESRSEELQDGCSVILDSFRVR